MLNFPMWDCHLALKSAPFEAISVEKHLSFYLYNPLHIIFERGNCERYVQMGGVKWHRTLSLAHTVVNSKIYFHLLLQRKPVYPASRLNVRNLMCVYCGNSGIVGFSSWTCAHRKAYTRIRDFFRSWKICVNFFVVALSGRGKNVKI